MRFRKKPVVIDAEQFFVNGKEWPSGVFGDAIEQHWIQTLEGPLRVSHGDWIITGIQGEKYPCKPDIFEATYERVEP